METKLILHHRTCVQLMKLTVNGIYTYMALKSLYNQKMEIQLLTAFSIAYQLQPDCINRNNNSKLFTCIEKGINELQKHGFIEVNEYLKDAYVMDMRNLKHDSVYGENGEVDKNNIYTEFDLDLLRQIYNDTGRKEIYKFLVYFCACKHENHEYFWFMKSRDEMVAECGFSARTLDKYTEILEANYIIHVFRNPYKWNDSHKQLPNLYGFYDDEVMIDHNGYAFIKSNQNKIYESALPKSDRTNVPVDADVYIKEEPVKPIEVKKQLSIVELDERIKKQKERDLFAEEPRWNKEKNPFI